MDLPSPTDPLTWLLVAAMAVARGLDFLSTRLVTPTLELEANPLMRRGRWVRMGLLNLPLPALPLLHHGLAVTFVVTSLLAAGSNLTAGALSRGMSEARHLEQQREALRRLGLGRALAMNSGGGLVVLLAGAFAMWLSAPPERLGWWAALGVAMFGLSGLVHFNIAIVRLHRGPGGKMAGTRRTPQADTPTAGRGPAAPSRRR